RRCGGLAGDRHPSKRSDPHTQAARLRIRRGARSFVRQRPRRLVGAAGCPRVVMWTQTYAPLGGSLTLSLLPAAMPLVVVGVILGVGRAPAVRVACAGLAAALVVALVAYRMPVPLAIAATAYGAAFVLFPIGWLVYSAILLFDVTVEAGCFDAIRHS